MAWDRISDFVRKHWLLILAVVAILTALGISFSLASTNREKLEREINTALQEIQAGREGWTDTAGLPRGVIVPRDVETYLPIVHEQGALLEDQVRRFRTGEGMYLWFFWNRESEAERYAAALAEERRIATALESALGAVRPQRVRVEAAIHRSQQTGSEALARLEPSSDEKDFQASITALGQARAGLADERDRLATVLARPPLASEQEGFSRALLAGLDHLAEEENQKAGRQAETSLQALAALEAYKSATAQSLDRSSGAIIWLDEVLEDTIPAVELAAGFAQACRKAVAFLTPILVLSPRVVANLESLDLFCRLVIAVEAEAQRMEAQIRPMADAMDAFAIGRERSSMLLILDRTPATLSTLDSLSQALDLALAPIEQVQGAVQDLANTVPEVPGVPDLLGGAGNILKATAQPFQSGKTALQESSTTLRNLQRREEGYRRTLEALAAGAREVTSLPLG